MAGTVRILSFNGTNDHDAPEIRTTNTAYKPKSAELPTTITYTVSYAQMYPNLPKEKFAASYPNYVEKATEDFVTTIVGKK